MIGPSMIPTYNRTQKSPSTTIKFLCSYGGKIVPRHSDGKLRYHGGETRVLAVDRSISFAELLVKLGEMNGTSVSLRCQLPTEDLDALVSITSDEDLANLIEEYDHRAESSSNSCLKIRAFLSPPKSAKKISPPPSMTGFSSNDTLISPPKSVFRPSSRPPKPGVARQMSGRAAMGKVNSQYGYHWRGNNGQIHLIHHGNHWQ